MHEKTPVRNVKRGEYVRLTVNGPVWIRGEYCKQSKTYELTSFADTSRATYLHGHRAVLVGFTF